MTDVPLSRITGCLLGLALGDAIGLPYEGVSRRRIEKLTRGKPLRHRLLLGRGMFSDDTEHAAMTAQAWLKCGGDLERFGRSLAWKLRWWLAALPGGTGLATLRAIIKLWLGMSYQKSGVFSAGNGPCMRAPVLGLVAEGDTLHEFVRVSTRITHTDPKAEEAALLVARATRLAATSNAEEFRPAAILRELTAEVEGSELLRSIAVVQRGLERKASAEDVAGELGLERGVTGYVIHTVPMALFCWLRHAGDFRASIEAVVRCGGDTDSTAAIVGALSGALLGTDALPEDWLHGLIDWPRSRHWLERLAARVAGPKNPLPLFWPAIPWRNGVFLLVVLAHGLRRLLPPY